MTQRLWLTDAGSRTIVGRLTVMILAACLLVPAVTAWSQITDDDRATVETLTQQLQEAGQLFAARRFSSSVEKIKDVQTGLAELTADGNRAKLRLTEKLYSSLQRAHGLLELEGYTLPVIEKPGSRAMAATVKPTTPDPTKPTPGMPATGMGGTSFVAQVVPILTGKCGGCHVTGNKGDFAMPTYEALMKGSKNGRVIQAGSSEGSHLFDLVTDKQMPPGGNKLTDAELAIVKSWIDEGAKFDGASPTANLGTLSPGPAAGMADAAPMIATATGNETVSFASQIAPILVTNCNGCHYGGAQVRGGLNFLTFVGLMKGGTTGPAITPGDAEGSLLIGKLKGTATGAKMPMGRQPLTDDQIALFETWITEGAKFDAPDPNATLAQATDAAFALSSTPEELTSKRHEEAVKAWRLGMARVPAETVETDRYLVMGSVNQATLQTIANTAESVTGKVAELFGAQPRETLVKGRITIFAVPQRYDYAEFAKMVERREIPADWQGHWRYSGVDAFATVMPGSTPAGLPSLVGEQLAGITAASLGPDVPEWFSSGIGRAAAGRIDPRDGRIEAWKIAFPAAFQAMKSPEDVVTNKLPPKEAALTSWAFAEFLLNDTRKFKQLVEELRAGKKFDDAFQIAYKSTPAEATYVWAKKPLR